MTPCSPNPLSFSAIRAEFGGTGPIVASAYRGIVAGVPSTGPLPLSTLRCKSAASSTVSGTGFAGGVNPNDNAGNLYVGYWAWLIYTGTQHGSITNTTYQGHTIFEIINHWANGDLEAGVDPAPPLYLTLSSSSGPVTATVNSITINGYTYPLTFIESFVHPTLGTYMSRWGAWTLPSFIDYSPTTVFSYNSPDLMNSAFTYSIQ